MNSHSLPIYFTTLEYIQEIVEKHDLAFSRGPGKTPDGRKKMAFLKDPDGYKIELIEYTFE